jgi:hypothetical protein
MINEIIPSFCVIELKGNSIEPVTKLAAKHGIQSVTIGTEEDPSDLHAFAAADKALNIILKTLGADKHQLDVKHDLNPDFFPLSVNREPSDAKKKERTELEELVEDLNSNLYMGDRIAIPLTRSFDPLGDFVMSRKTVNAEDFSITVKVLASIPEYVKLKTLEKEKEIEKFIPFHRDTAQRMH